MNRLLVERVRSEYRDLPGLRLTLAQASRLWAVPPDECRAALNALVASGDLYQDERGQYARRGRLLRLHRRVAHWTSRELRFASTARATD